MTAPEPAKGPSKKEQVAKSKAHAVAVRLALTERNMEMGRKLVR